MSSLLEHLLEGDELLAKHGDDEAKDPLHTKPVEPEKEPLNAGPPSTTTSHANPPEQERQLSPTSELEAEEKLSERENTPGEASSTASAAPPSASNTCSSFSRATPVILVGFGTGANSLLHLAAGPLSQERNEDLGGGGDGDGGCTLRDDAGGELLNSVLCRKGFRVGGLILVNGFISLDEQSTQARRMVDAAVFAHWSLSKLGLWGGR